MNLDEMTKEQLIQYINELNEERNGKYGLVWDKEREPEKIVQECNKYIPVLEEIKEKEINNNGENNILIEGDNFHALEVLNYTHKEKIDVIYIDPPYNTGKDDFMYNDKFINLEDGYRHSKWLNFMSKRLKLARNLLKADGFIMISIDDNEYAQLKLLCDSIFGENNRLSIHHVQVRYSDKTLNEKNDWQPVMEYVLIYAKNKTLFKLNKPEIDYDTSKFNLKITELGKSEEIILGGKKVEIFKPGSYKIENVEPSLNALKSTWASGSVLKGNTSGKFFDKQLAPRKEMDGLNVLYKVYGIGEDGLGYRYFTGPKKANATKGQFYSGIPLERLEQIKNGTAIKEKSIPNIMDFSPDFGNIRQEGGISFNSGKKPIKMLKEFINYHPNKNATILDFFAGSGSTGHAVLDLNNDDDGNRKFVLCTNNENNICEEITYKRIGNVIKGYSNREPIKGSLKYYKTDFIKNEGTRDQLYFNLTSKCLPMLCVKEDTFITVMQNESYAIFKNEDNSKYSCIYYDLFDSRLNEFIDQMKNIDEEKIIYEFELGNSIDVEKYNSLKNYSVEAMPSKIMELYKKMIKMSKED